LSIFEYYPDHDVALVLQVNVLGPYDTADYAVRFGVALLLAGSTQRWGTSLNLSSRESRGWKAALGYRGALVRRGAAALRPDGGGGGVSTNSERGLPFIADVLGAWTT